MTPALRFLVLICIFSSVAGAAEVYKWVDEKGVVHYSDKPPPEEQVIEMELRDERGVSGAAEGESVYGQVIEQQRASKELRAQQKLAEAEALKAEQEKASLSQENCSRAIHYLNTLQRQCPVFYDGAGILRAQCPGYYYFYEGDRTYIEDTERAELIQHYREVVEECTKASAKSPRR